jgi:hypothetical protein
MTHVARTVRRALRGTDGGDTMSVEERRRIRPFERWADTWSREDAEAMLELFPPPGHALATSEDIAHLGARIDGLDAKLESRFQTLDAKIDATKVELELRMDAMAAELTAVFRSEIQRAIVTQTRITVFSMVTAFAAVSALALGLG